MAILGERPLDWNSTSKWRKLKKLIQPLQLYNETKIVMIAELNKIKETMERWSKLKKNIFNKFFVGPS